MPINANDILYGIFPSKSSLGDTAFSHREATLVHDLAQEIFQIKSLKEWSIYEDITVVALAQRLIAQSKSAKIIHGSCQLSDIKPHLWVETDKVLMDPSLPEVNVQPLSSIDTYTRPKWVGPWIGPDMPNYSQACHYIYDFSGTCEIDSSTQLEHFVEQALI